MKSNKHSCTVSLASLEIFAFAGKTRDGIGNRQDQRWDRQSAIGKIFAFFMIRVTFAIGKTRDWIGKTRD
jgi:hypothetical protein